MTRRKSAAFDPSEDQLHRAVAEFLDTCLLPSTVWTTFPAGWGRFGVALAVRLKRSGLKPGMPDIWILRRADEDSTYIVCLELKRPGENLSANQLAMFPKLRDAGIAVYVCRSLEDVIAALEEQQVPLRKHQWQGAVQREPKRKPPDETSERRDTTGDADGATSREAI